MAAAGATSAAAGHGSKPKMVAIVELVEDVEAVTHSDHEADEVAETIAQIRRKNRKTKLYEIKVQKVIESLQPCTPEEVGSEDWWMKRSSVNLIWVSMKGGFDSYSQHLVKHGKLAVLIHDMIMITIWNEEILSQFVSNSRKRAEEEEDDETELCGKTLCAVLKQQVLSTSIVAAVLENPEAVKTLGSNNALDLIEYSVAMLKYFIATKPDHDPRKIEIVDNKNPQMSYDERCKLAEKSIECLLRLCQNMEVLSEEVAAKLLHPSTELLLTCADLLLTRPFQYTTAFATMRKFRNAPAENPDSKFNLSMLPCEDSEVRLPAGLEPGEYFCIATEVSAWTILYLLLILKSETSEAKPQFTEKCLQKLLLLKRVMKSYAYVDSMPGAWEVKACIEIFSVIPPRTINEAELPAPALSPYYLAIRTEVAEKKEAIIGIHEAMNTFESVNEEDKVKRSVRVESCLTNDVNHCCFKCGKPGAWLRCSRCRYAYYCDRRCQRKDWAEHKKMCDPKNGPKEVGIQFQRYKCGCIRGKVAT